MFGAKPPAHACRIAGGLGVALAMTLVLIDLLLVLPTLHQDKRNSFRRYR